MIECRKGYSSLPENSMKSLAVMPISGALEYGKTKTFCL